MESSQHDEFIEFDQIRSLIDLENPRMFKYYLKDVYRDLSERKQSDKKLGVSKVNFFEYIKKIQYFLADKLFVALDENEDDHLNLEELMQGLFHLYLGKFDDTLKIIFNLIDFNKDGKIEKEDMEICLSYLPIVDDESEKISAKHQLKSREEIKEIVNDTFGNNATLTFQEYKTTVELKNSESFLHILCYFYINRPFSNANLEIYKAALKKPVMEDKLDHSPSMGAKIISPKKSIHLPATKLITTNFGEIIKEFDNFDIDEDAPKNDVGIQLLNNPQNNGVEVDVMASPVLRMNRIKGKENVLESPSTFLRKLDRKQSEQLGSPKGKLRALKKEGSSKQEITHEGWICKITENGKVKKFYLVLINNDIYYYKTDSKKDYQGMHNISGCHFKDQGVAKFDNHTLFVFAILFSNKERKYYCETKEDFEEWKGHIKQALGFTLIKDHYDLGEDLGNGKFGAVRLGIHKKTGEKVAVKIISKEKMDNKDLELVNSEIDIMKMCLHDNVVRILDHYESSNTIYIIMEYLQGGNLNDYLENIDPSAVTEDFAAFVVRQICWGLKYLHSYGVVHRDLKPDNIMICQKDIQLTASHFSCIKIMDFGLSKILGKNERASEGYGTLSFVAPEVLTRNPYGRPIDVWSVGIIIYYMVSGLLPFDDEQDDEEVIAKRIVFSELKFPSKQFSKRSPELKSLVKSLLVKSQEKRVTIEDALEHDWFKKYGNI